MSKIDIEELFRANQHKLTERPSRQAWEKLEGRLDKHRGRHRIGRGNYYKMVAALAFLVVMVGALSLSTKNKAARNAAVDLEEMDTSHSQEALQVVEFTRHHHERLAKPMEEGSDDKAFLLIKK